MMEIVRKYSSYQEYVDHQKEKTTDPIRRKTWMGKEWLPKVEEFKRCFVEFLGSNLSGKKCLGVCSRVGQEIQAFKNLGADAIGIDLVPCKPLVVEGDMHSIPFPDNEFDILFCNSIDHSLYPEKFVVEIQRVLKPQGLVLLLLFFFRDSYGKRGQKYDICEMKESKDMIQLFDSMKVIQDKPFKCLGSSWMILLKGVG